MKNIVSLGLVAVFCLVSVAAYAGIKPNGGGYNGGGFNGGGVNGVRAGRELGALQLSGVKIDGCRLIHR